MKISKKSIDILYSYLYNNNREIEKAAKLAETKIPPLHAACKPPAMETSNKNVKREQLRVSSFLRTVFYIHYKT